MVIISTIDSYIQYNNVIYALIGSCSGLVLAFLGTQTRMRAKADVSVQKWLGLGSDTLGTLSLVFALVVFRNSCLEPLRKDFDIRGNNIQISLTASIHM